MKLSVQRPLVSQNLSETCDKWPTSWASKRQDQDVFDEPFTQSRSRCKKIRMFDCFTLKHAEERLRVYILQADSTQSYFGLEAAC